MKKITKAILLTLLLITVPFLSACTQSKKEVSISVLSSSYNDGAVKGGSTYKEDDTATLIARANTNKTFVAWVKNNKIVSTEESFSFKVTPLHGGTYTAVFKGNSPTYLKPFAVALSAKSLKPEQTLTIQKLALSFVIEDGVQTFNLHSLDDMDFGVYESENASSLFDFDSEYLLRLRSDYENRKYTLSANLTYTFGEISITKHGESRFVLAELEEINNNDYASYYQTTFMVKDANLEAEVSVWFAPAGSQISSSDIFF